MTHGADQPSARRLDHSGSAPNTPRGGRGPNGVDPLVDLLLPILLHKLNNATQLLTGVHALMQLEPDEDSLARHGEDLAHTSRKVDDLGWLLALVASIGGANLMLERREERGLDLLLALLADALRRKGVRLEPAESRCRLAPSARGGWQVPWAVGAYLHAAAAEQMTEGADALLDARPLIWALRRRGDEAWITAAGEREMTELEELLRERLPEARLEREGGRTSLVLPGEWLPPMLPPLEA